MLKRLQISNFKSIYDESIDLGRFNVFIGENGSGKTNILEALGMISAAAENKLSNDELALKGIRVAKPSITFSSFLREKQREEIDINYDVQNDSSILNVKISLKPDVPNDIFSKWNLDLEITDSDSKLVLSASEINKQIHMSNELYDHLKDIRSYLDELNNEFSKNTITKIKELENKLSNISSNLDAIDIDFRENPTTYITYVNSYKIFNLSTQVLRGIGGISREIPGIRGENLDRLIESFDKEERAKLEEYAYFINWLHKIEIDKEDRHKLDGHKLDMSTSILYFRDKYMQRKNNLFSAENANEGVLHILFYLALFISKHTSKFFAIDNIETALNPELCKKLIEQLVKLSKETDRQVLITTHSPAVLDGLNLHHPDQRLFKVYRNKKGHTKVKRIELKPDQNFNGQGLKLSELWMRNHIGAIPQNL